MADDPTKTGPAADPEPEEGDEPLEDDPEGGEDPDGGEPEWKAPTREEWEAHQAKLTAETAKLARARAQAKKLREGKPADGAPGEGGAPAAGNADVDVWKGRAVRAAAKAELLDRGADPDMVDLALARLKPGEIEFDADDEPELDDWLDEMVDRYPKLFVKAAAAPAQEPRPRPGRVNQAAPASGTPARPKMSLGEAIIAKSEAARIAGRRGIRG